jgi:tetratricopeptide (TPR) repeat protein
VATALASVGWYHCQLGNYQQALSYCEQALGQFRELGNQYGQAAAWDTIGCAHQQAGIHGIIRLEEYKP